MTQKSTTVGTPCSFEIQTGEIQTGHTEKATKHGAVRSYSLGQKTSRLPLLPKTKRAEFSSHRHDANPALATKVLSDIQHSVEGWHQELREVLLKIQGIYMEGPIVEGWLEAVDGSPMPESPHPNGGAEAMLRHADPKDLQGYIDRICARSLSKNIDSQSPQVRPSGVDGSPEYRLCSLDGEGRLQCQPCPTDQLPFVSMAIARHQKLRQLLNRKQYLSAKLKRAVDVLSQARDDLGIVEQ